MINLLTEGDVTSDIGPYVVKTGGKRDLTTNFLLLVFGVLGGVAVAGYAYVTGHILVTPGVFCVCALVIAIYTFIVRPEAEWTFSHEGFHYRGRSLFGGRELRVAACDIAEIGVKVTTVRGKPVSYRLVFTLRNGTKLIMERDQSREQLLVMVRQLALRLPQLRWPGLG